VESWKPGHGKSFRVVLLFSESQRKYHAPNAVYFYNTTISVFCIMNMDGHKTISSFFRNVVDIVKLNGNRYAYRRQLVPKGIAVKTSRFI